MTLCGAVLLAGCPPQGAVCGTGQSACGDTCLDITSDAKNCGACGFACRDREVCADSICQCQAGSTWCGNACADLQSNGNDCGACGHACQAGDVCEGGACKVECSKPGFTRCGSACVDLQADAANCGACGAACADVRSCHAGTCAYDVVAACFNKGVLVGIQSGTDRKGPLAPTAPNPQALASTPGGGLLIGDGVDKHIHQASRGLDLYAVTTGSGGDIRHLVVDEPYVYVVEDGSNTLQILQRGAPAEGGGSQYATVGQLALGANTNPQAIARVGNSLYVPLYGGFGAGAAAGQAVAVVDVSDKTNPRLTDTLSLGGLDLKAFNGGASLPRPSWAAVRKGKVYVPLNNLQADYSVGGPGLLARIDPANHNALSTVDLGEGCLNAGFVLPFGDSLVVGCGGSTTYNADYTISTTSQTGVVLLGPDDQRVSFASMDCPANQSGCQSASATHVAVRGNRLYVGDASQGRVFVLEVVNGQLVERHGFHGSQDGGRPLDVCPPGAFGSLVSDLISMP